ncbi:beta carbonic anhydrase 1 [Lingula anatina]|uniref:Carbonic anhydrase n=1 Tax=Lingula anatina TaxID=7574 RepID=A0A1S3H8J2_LINAN|nr:beta carbonic anhydrase 1 [Lingula anatina]|eukprot:XP_013382323.1 beta carbonic anhydrase 1 [Lingula anatina]
MPGIDKLLKGVLKYRSTIKDEMTQKLKEVTVNPQPTAVVFSCMDARVLPTRFCQTDVGDVYLVRNAGNLVPHSKGLGWHNATTEPGALVLGCQMGDIRHVVVCGHSDCKAMNLLYSMRNELDHHDGDALQLWLRRHGSSSVQKFEQWEKMKGREPITFQAETPRHNIEALIDPENNFGIVDKFSQINTLNQLQNIASYPFLKEKLQTGKVRLHALWFDIHSGNVYIFSKMEKKFVEINEENYGMLMEDSVKDPKIKHY